MVVFSGKGVSVVVSSQFQISHLKNCHAKSHLTLSKVEIKFTNEVCTANLLPCLSHLNWLKKISNPKKK